MHEEHFNVVQVVVLYQVINKSDIFEDCVNVLLMIEAWVLRDLVFGFNGL